MKQVILLLQLVPKSLTQKPIYSDNVSLKERHKELLNRRKCDLQQ